METKAVNNVIAALAALGILAAASAAPAATPKKRHAPLHHIATHHRAQYVLRRTPSQSVVIVDRRPVAAPRQVPATPVPQTPGDTPANQPVVEGGSGDTRTPMTPPGVGGTGVPGGPGTQP